MTPPTPDPDEGPLRPSEQARLEIARLAVGDGSPLPTVFRRVCEIAADTLGVERVGVWLPADGGAAVRCANLFERSKRQHGEGVTLRVADFPTYFAAVTARRALPSEFAQFDPRTAELREAYLAPLGITSMLDAPILRNGEFHGVVCHEHVGPRREWTTEDRDFAMSVADLVANAIKAAELNLTKTALREQEAERTAAERAEAVGRLAGGVAHDFRNLLTVILGNAALIAARPGLPPDVTAQAQQIVAAAERGSGVVRELLDLDQDEAAAPRVLDVPAMVEGFAPVLGAALGDRHQLEFRREAAGGKVLIDRAHLERLVLNLVLNARDAMPGGGTVAVAVGQEETSANGGPPGAYVRLEVRDGGAGIDPAVRGRMFEPYFTTKPAGQGTGLGLAVVRRVVDRVGGFIRVVTAAGAGTTFRVYLPRVGGDSRDPESAEGSAPAAQG